ncbi:MAG: hypothetical protein C4326_08240 [Ignavibacteria bacterium]
MAVQLLPLFPLQVVLFPQSVLPLHIFEERYKQLIAECLDEGKAFGINLITEAGLAKVGCTATVLELVKRYADGRMDILVEGGERYLLEKVVASQTLFSVGQVKFFEQRTEALDEALAEETIRLHNRLVEMVYREEAYKVEFDAANPQVSFKIAQKAGMELSQRQVLLATESENERLRLLHAYFVEVIPKLERLSEVERIVKGDGYIVH